MWKEASTFNIGRKCLKPDHMEFFKWYQKLSLTCTSQTPENGKMSASGQDWNSTSQCSRYVNSQMKQMANVLQLYSHATLGSPFTPGLLVYINKNILLSKRLKRSYTNICACFAFILRKAGSECCSFLKSGHYFIHYSISFKFKCTKLPSSTLPSPHTLPQRCL